MLWDIQENEEALVVRCPGTCSGVVDAKVGQGHQVNDMHLYLLRYGRWL